MNGYESYLAKKTFYIAKSMVLLVLIATLLSGCFGVFVFAGRGDWSIPINENYKIARSNGYKVALLYTAEEPYIISKYLLDNYYICHFYVCEQTIYLSGIPTADKYATEEELKSEDYYYCIVDMPTQTVTGPLSVEAWEKQCTQLGIDMTGKWIPATYETAEAMKETAATPTSTPTTAAS